MKQKLGVFLVLCGLFLVSTAAGSSLSIPHQFQAGAKAVAEEVNANFEAARQAVNDNDQRLSHLFGEQAQRLVVSKAPGDFQSIQEAIDAVPVGEPFVIDVLPGTYVENLTMRPDIHLRGAGREVTVVQAADGTQPTILINALENVAISGLAISGGTPGIQVTAASPTVDQNAVTRNLGHGILNLQGAAPIITSNAVSAN